jgi:hypothetical protein
LLLLFYSDTGTIGQRISAKNLPSHPIFAQIQD